MPRVTRKNTLPQAAFNLRTTGPQLPQEIDKRIGQGWRAATRWRDPMATLDPAPCPHCQGAVEWAPTSASLDGKVVRYIYARCRENKSHAWGFRAQTVPTIIDETPPPRPSAGARVMANWIDNRINEIEKEIKNLQEIRRLANEIRPLSEEKPRENHKPS